MTKPARQRLEDRCIPVPESGCLIWLGALDGSGYGIIRIDGKTFRTHRASFYFANNGIPDGLHVLHHCDIRCCINPDHLYTGTNSDNIADKVKRGRVVTTFKNGADNPNAVLTAEKVKEIRLSTLTQVEIAKKYGVGQTTVSDIKTNKIWKD